MGLRSGDAVLVSNILEGGLVPGAKVDFETGQGGNDRQIPFLGDITEADNGDCQGALRHGRVGWGEGENRDRREGGVLFVGLG